MSEHSKSEYSNSTGKMPPTDDFRETLIKSGLDISMFQVEESNDANLSDEESSAELAKNKSSRTFWDLTKSGKKALPQFGRKQPLIAIVGILVIIVLQFVFQLSFVQEEHLRSAENLIKSPLPVEKVAKPSIPEVVEEAKIEIKTEYKKTKAETLILPKTAIPKVQRGVRISNPQMTFRKKETNESTAERLRRAERILTGI